MPDRAQPYEDGYDVLQRKLGRKPTWDEYETYMRETLAAGLPIPRRPGPRYRIINPPAGWVGKVWGVLDTRSGDPIAENLDHEAAKLIIRALNALKH